MFKEFKTFIMRGSALEMAVGIIIGASFGSIVTSVVDDIIMPPVGLLLGNVDFTNLFITLKYSAGASSYATLTEAKAAGAVTLNYGIFLNTVISFLIVAFAVFILIKTFNKIQKDQVSLPTVTKTRKCEFCQSKVPVKAVKCAFCTSNFKTK